MHLHIKKNTIYNPNNEIIFIHKQRPLIFTQQYNQKHKKKTFQTIYSNPIFNQLSFLISDQYQLCECQNSIKECSKLKDILNDQKKHNAKAIFQHLKEQVKETSPHEVMKNSQIEVSEVLQPHYNCLLTVLQVQNPSIIAQLLKHAKIDYTTFWIYGLYVSKFSQFDILSQNILKIVENNNLDVDLQNLLNPINGQLKIAYQWKLLNIFRSSFASIVKIVCQKLRGQMIIQKLIICYYIKGRERKQFQVIKAALQIQLL